VESHCGPSLGFVLAAQARATFGSQFSRPPIPKVGGRTFFGAARRSFYAPRRATLSIPAWISNAYLMVAYRKGGIFDSLPPLPRTEMELPRSDKGKEKPRRSRDGVPSRLAG
jgi:hypothetical protein